MRYTKSELVIRYAVLTELDWPCHFVTKGVVRSPGRREHNLQGPLGQTHCFGTNNQHWQALMASSRPHRSNFLFSCFRVPRDLDELQIRPVQTCARPTKHKPSPKRRICERKPCTSWLADAEESHMLQPTQRSQAGGESCWLGGCPCSHQARPNNPAHIQKSKGLSANKTRHISKHEHSQTRSAHITIDEKWHMGIHTTGSAEAALGTAVAVAGTAAGAVAGASGAGAAPGAGAGVPAGASCNELRLSASRNLLPNLKS